MLERPQRVDEERCTQASRSTSHKCSHKQAGRHPHQDAADRGVCRGYLAEEVPPDNDALHHQAMYQLTAHGQAHFKKCVWA
jgi:hypothetical protein